MRAGLDSIQWDSLACHVIAKHQGGQGRGTWMRAFEWNAVHTVYSANIAKMQTE